jgi:hypothetical protein
MTKEGLADLLVENNYALFALLVVICGLHNTQLQLSVSTLQLLGPGELSKRNVMQLLQCICIAEFLTYRRVVERC